MIAIRFQGIAMSAFRGLALLTCLAASTSLTAVAAEKVIAYVVPAGTPGNQAFGGTLGMEFEVANPIIVTQLGVFDDNSDGMKLTIPVRLYDISDPENPTVIESLEFTPESEGTLIGGSRFKPLAAPRRLEVGFKGAIVAEGYGADERLRNTLGVIANRTWTVNDGSGSLLFVGSARYGTVAGEYPNVPDGGPADRYCAGTFEFETTPPLKPGAPQNLTIEPSATSITLRWTAVTNPLPAVKYEVWRAATRDGAFAKVADAATTEYADANLGAGASYCYRVRGIGATGQQGVDSATTCAATFELPAGQRVAYMVKAGINGTQAFDGPIGMDFEVVNAVIVTHLGVFDAGSDGLGRTITARLWDRAQSDAPVELGSVEFTPESLGVLVRGSRFKALPAPVRLEAGFRGTISAENYGAAERLYNPGGNPAVVRPWTVDSGSGSLTFTGTGRYGTVAAEFPGTPDGGAPDRYGAGTFQFQTTELVNPGTPVVALRRGDRLVQSSWSAVVEPVAAAKYRVLRGIGDADLVQIAEVASPGFADEGLTKGTQYCYSVVAVTAAGKAGLPSPRACLVAEAREPGAAYVVEAGTAGTQAFGGALGMDFDVLTPVRVTRLGVFDDGSDGIFLPINARLYNRATREVLATLDFTQESPGDLVGGSRFKNLAQAIVLPTGFRGTMAVSGYGTDERNGNVGVAGLSVFAGGGALAFVGTASYGVDPAGYPNVPDGGPANRYAAGTFFFEPMAEAPVLAISRSGAKLKLTWSGGGTLESSPALPGTWNAVSGAVSGVEIDPAGVAGFYRVKQ